MAAPRSLRSKVEQILRRREAEGEVHSPGGAGRRVDIQQLRRKVEAVRNTKITSNTCETRDNSVHPEASDPNVNLQPGLEASEVEEQGQHEPSLLINGQQSEPGLESFESVEEVGPETKALVRRSVSDGIEVVKLNVKVQRRTRQLPVVVHSTKNTRNLKRWDKLSSVQWSQSFKEFLFDRNIREATELQSVLWPLISRVSSLVAVGPRSQGKTLGWLLPLVDCLHVSHYPHLPPGHSPLCVVLCPGVEVAYNVYRTLHDVVDGAGLSISSLLSCHGTPQPQPADFINGVDVLVTSPAKLLRLLNDQMLNLGRLCHLVIEEAETSLDIWMYEIRAVAEVWKRSRGKLSGNDQVVAVAERWSEHLESFTKTILAKFANPTVVIASPMEGLVYGTVPMNTVLYDQEDSAVKKRHLREIVQETSSKARLVICCRDGAATTVVKLTLNEMGVRCVLINTESDVYHINEALDVRSGAVLVICDAVLPCLQLPGADRGTVLVHWDLPRDNKKHFLLRFLFVQDGLKNIFTGTRAQSGRVHLLVSRTEELCLKTLMSLLQRCGQEVPQLLHSLHTTLREKEAGQGPLCLTMVELGACSQERTGRCSSRHQLQRERDQPLEVLQQTVEFTILHLESAVRYWVRLQSDQAAFKTLVWKMARHFAKPESRRPLTEVSSTLIAASHEALVYQRARVVRWITEVEEDEEKIVKADVFLIDFGRKVEVDVSALASLPAELGETHFPALARLVVVSGVVPGDRDTHWGLATHLSRCQMELESQHERDVLCRGRVRLHLRSVLVVDRCQVMELQPAIGRYVCKVETVDYLVSKAFAVRDETPIVRLLDMAGKAGISLPPDETEETEEFEAVDRNMRVIRAFLPRSEDVVVQMTECLDPGHFYLAQWKYWTLVEKMEKEMKDIIENGLKRRFRSQDKFVAVKEGDVYKRAKVLEKLENSDQNDEEATEQRILDVYRVVFVDEGIEADVSVEKMFRVKSEIFTRLPFQAVRCGLAGVRPVGSEWSRQAGDQLFDLTRTSLDDPKLLHCRALHTDVDGAQLVELSCDGVGLARILTEEQHACVVSTPDLVETSSRELTDSEDDLDSEEDFVASNDLLKDMMGLLKSEKEAAKVREAPAKNKNDIPPSDTSSAKTHTLSLSPPSIVKKPVNILWSQTRGYVRLSVKVASKMDFTLDQVHVRCDSHTFSLQVAEEDHDESVLHGGEVLQLQNPVCPRKTEVKLVSGGLSVKIFKKDQKKWSQLCLSKFQWIRIDPEFIEDSDEEDALEDAGENYGNSIAGALQPKVEVGCEFNDQEEQEVTELSYSDEDTESED